MTRPEGEPINTGLEVNIGRHNKLRLERFRNKEILVIDRKPELNEILQRKKKIFPRDSRVRVTDIGQPWVAHLSDATTGQMLELDDLVINPNVKVLIRDWHNLKNLPNAIRNERKIHSEYLEGGREYEDLRTVKNVVNDGIRSFRLHRIKNLDDIKREATNAAEILDLTYRAPRKPEKRQVKDRIERAYALFGIHGPFNPSVTEMILAYAQGDITLLYEGQRYPRDKHGVLADKFSIRNGMERSSLEATRSAISAFRKIRSRSREYDSAAEYLRIMAEDFLSEKAVMAQPYREAALLVRGALIGIQIGNETEILQNMGVDDYDIEYFYADFPMEREQGHVRDALLRKCIERIDFALEKGERLLKGTWEEPEPFDPSKYIPDDPFEGLAPKNN